MTAHNDLPNQSQPHLNPLFVHARRSDWGRAILAWEGRDKRRYQFEDGRLRTFKEGYYHLFDEVDCPRGTHELIADQLLGKLDLSRARLEVKQDAEAKGKHVVTLDDQITIFERLYPHGFEGTAWRSEVRGAGAPRRLKRHRNPLLGDARALLRAESLRPRLRDGEHEAVFDEIVALLASTDLVRRARDVRPLESWEGDQKRAFVVALDALLWGEGDAGERFDAWMKVLPNDASWELATVLPAIAQPERRAFVTRSVTNKQARWMAPRLSLTTQPQSGQWLRAEKMMRRVHEQLIARGKKPLDWIDVRDFVWTTLRPKSLRLLEEVR